MKKWILSVILLLALCGGVYAQDEPPRDTLIDAVVAASQPNIIETSTQGDYTASVTVYPCTAIDGQEMSYERLDITDNTTNETHLIADQLIYCGGLGGFGLSIGRWMPSADGEGEARFLYYTDAREGEPDGAVLGWERPLWRVNLADFQVESLNQAKFSLTAQELVAWDQNQIRVVSAYNDESTDFPLMPAGLQMVEVTWLPLNSGVIYIQTDKLIGGSRNTVTHIDLATMEQTVILDTNE